MSFREVSQKRDRLDGLSKTHFICKDTVDPLFVERGQPVQPFQLVLLQLGHQHVGLANRERTTE